MRSFFFFHPSLLLRGRRRPTSVWCINASAIIVKLFLSGICKYTKYTYIYIQYNVTCHVSFANGTIERRGYVPLRGERKKASIRSMHDCIYRRYNTHTLIMLMFLSSTRVPL